MDEQDCNRCNPADQGRARQQPQPSDLAIDQLAPHLQTKGFLRSTALLFELSALEFEPRVITIERFLQSGDDDVGQTAFDLVGDPLRSSRRNRCVGLRRRRVRETSCRIAQRDRRVVGPEEVGDVH